MSKPGDSSLFNVRDGFLEAVVRGYRSKLLKQSDYANLFQCETLDDLKLHLAQTDYGDFLVNEPSPLHTTTIREKCMEKMVKEFQYIRCQAVGSLALFLDYITYGYMIDNIVLFITGALHDRNPSELLEKCHPLGMFQTMTTVSVARSISELYHAALIDTPLGPFFKECLFEEELDEMNIEVVRNTLYKSYLQAFYKLVCSMEGETARVMKDILEFEADRRAINITINSFGTDLTPDDRIKLFPNFGILYPEITDKLGSVEDLDQVKQAVDNYIVYRNIFQELAAGDRKCLEDLFFEYEVSLNKSAFMTQYGYGVFYAWVRLKEQEIRNIVWIAECISQDQKEKIDMFVPIF